MQRISAYIKGIATVAALFVFTVVQFESMTGLSSAWERPENRKLLEARMTVNHSGLRDGKPHFFQSWFDANVVEIQKYSNQYQCASGKDKAKCLPAKKR